MNRSSWLKLILPAANENARASCSSRWMLEASAIFCSLMTGSTAKARIGQCLLDDHLERSWGSGALGEILVPVEDQALGIVGQWKPCGPFSFLTW